MYQPSAYRWYLLTKQLLFRTIHTLLDLLTINNISFKHGQHHGDHVFL